MNTPVKVEYESETCTRCGGTGDHSYCEAYGRTCFKCSGSGKMLTKRGQAASAYANNLLKVTVEQFSKMEGAKARGEVMGKLALLVSAKEVWNGSKRNGVEIPMYQLFRADGSLAYSADGRCTVRLVATADHIADIAAYQESLTKMGKPRKTGVK